MGRTWLLRAGAPVCPVPGEGLRPRRRAPAVGEIRYTVCLGQPAPGRPGDLPRPSRPARAVVTLSVSDRGRGEALTSRLRLDGAGIPLSRAAHRRRLLEEPDRRELRARRRQGRLEQRRRRRGRRRSPARLLRHPAPASLLEIGLLAMALLQSPDHRLPLLPEGEARIESVGAARIAAAESRANLTLYSLRARHLADLRLDGPRRRLLRPLRRLRHRRPARVGRMRRRR